MGKHPRLRRSVFLAAGIAAIAAVAVVAGISLRTHRNPFAVIAAPLVPPPAQLFGKSNLLVLLVGLDYDYNDKDEEYSSQSRSDVIKAINLDFTNGKIYELSVPRDMDAVLPNGEEAKINQAQADGGITETQAVVAKWLSIPRFDRYVILRINTTKDLIDAIGGVDVDVMNSDALLHRGANGPLDYTDSWGHLNIHLKPGLQHLTGGQAVGYARFRHDWCGDPCRIMRQDQIVKAIVNKLKSDKLNTLFHASALIGVFNRDVQTNLTPTEELSLATAFIGISPSDIKSAQVPYVADKVLPDGGDVIIPDQTEKAKLVRTMLVAPPSPLPSPSAVALAAIAPSTIRVDVENGTNVAGLAHAIARDLRARGFIVTNVGNASIPVQNTQIVEHSTLPFAGAKVRAELNAAAAKAQIVSQSPQAAPPSPSGASDVTVIVGRDLVPITQAPAPIAQPE